MIKRIACLFLLVCLVLNQFCFLSGKSVYDFFMSNTTTSYSDTVSMWKNTVGQVDGEFATLGASVTPGQAIQNTAQTGTDEVFSTSVLSDITLLQFYYEGENYAYGIDTNGNETVAVRRPNGQKIDVMDGFGKFYANNSSNKSLVRASTVEVFSKDTDENGNVCLDVTYLLSGNDGGTSTVSARYVFYRESVGVCFNVSAISASEFLRNKSGFSRTYIQGYDKTKEYVKVNSQWVYPKNLDNPYQEFESLAYTYDIGSTAKMYTFLRGEHFPDTFVAEETYGNRLPVYFNTEKNDDGTYKIDFTYTYDWTAVDSSEDDIGSDYLALFRGKQSDFAAGIAAVNPESDNSTMFVGNSVALNINVTNLTAKKLTFSLRYDVRDYYGNVVASGLFTDNKLNKNTQVNRNVTVSGKYGMYYLNLYVISNNSSYTECYPFALLEPHQYKYNNTNPFGINNFNYYKNDMSQLDRMAKLSAKMGVATLRTGSGNTYFLDRLIEQGITRFNGITGACYNAEDVESYMAGIKSTVEKLLPYVQSIEFGNEMNLYAVDDESLVDEVYGQFYNYTFTPTYEFMKENYPEIDYIPSCFSTAQTAWIERMTSNVDGVWDLFDICSIHAYGYPIMPDRYGTRSLSYSEAWNIECSLERAANAMKTYGNKKLYVTEVGYPTPLETDSTVCLRTQADYSVRVGAMCLAYGADVIQYYCAFDRTQYYTGFNNTDREWNYGLMYEADYYGVIKPKPAAVAFAVMTRKLESVEIDSGNISGYDEGYNVGGIRAFTVNTEEYGNMLIAYSNSEVLSNGKKDINGNSGLRTPSLPWNSQWKQTDMLELETDSSQIAVCDIMGNTAVYESKSGKVSIPLNGSPVYIYGF